MGFDPPLESNLSYEELNSSMYDKSIFSLQGLGFFVFVMYDFWIFSLFVLRYVELLQ